jgi:hypothetical protein
MSEAPNDELELGGEGVQEQQDYFGFLETGEFVFPDGVSRLDLLAMNEGKKKEYQKKTQSDVTLVRGGDAKLKIDAATARHELIKGSVIGWNLVRQGAKVTFSDRNLAAWLEQANPKIVEDVEKEIRKLNPWLLDELTVEQIDKEIENLQELRAAAVERELGKAA